MTGRRIRLAILLADIAAVPFALFLACLVRYGRTLVLAVLPPHTWEGAVVVLAAMMTWVALYEFMSLDCFREGWRLGACVSRLALAVALQMSVGLAGAYLAQLYYSRLVLGYFAIFFLGSILFVRLVVYQVLRMRHRAGKSRRVVIVGEGRISRELVQRLNRHPELLYQVVGVLNPISRPGGDQQGPFENGPEELSSLDALKLFEDYKISELIVCLDDPPLPDLPNFLARCREQRIRVNLVPQPYELYSSRAKLIEIEGVPLLSLEGPPDFRLPAAFKRATDLLLGLPLAICASPILAISASVLKIQGHRLLRRELRCGQHGKKFWMYRLDVDRDAPDVTGFERLLRRLSISELPQLFNVIWGDMNLVGPRPETPERVRDYTEWQRQRLMIKPGITGLAQVNGLREQHSSEEKTRYDLKYIVHWNPVLDIVLLLETMWTIAARLRDKTEPVFTQTAKTNRRSSVLSRFPVD